MTVKGSDRRAILRTGKNTKLLISAPTLYNSLRNLFSWSYDGVDNAIAGNGGKSCTGFLPLEQKVVESVLAVVYGLFLIRWSYKNISLPDHSALTERASSLKQFLLVALCLTFGIEVGFKFATRQMIWLLTPCHVTTMMQIYILAARPSRLVTAVFRVHMYLLTGASIAIIFPVVNTRLLLFETGVYYVQHYLILIIPWCLLRVGGVYTLEPVTDMSWAAFSLGVIIIYHVTLIQYLSILLRINLNLMLCPGRFDTFYGNPQYRIMLMAYASLLMPLHGKLYAMLAKRLCGPTTHDEPLPRKLANSCVKQE